MTPSWGSRCVRGANVSAQHADVARRPQGISVAKALGSASWSRNLHAGVTSMDVLPTAIISYSSLVTMTSRRMSSCTRESFARLWTSRFRVLSVIEWATCIASPASGA